MEPRLISIIIPFYKQEKTIEETLREIEKVLKRLPMDYEIIVAVDGLKDRTLERTG